MTVTDLIKISLAMGVSPSIALDRFLGALEDEAR